MNAQRKNRILELMKVARLCIGEGRIADALFYSLTADIATAEAFQTDEDLQARNAYLDRQQVRIAELERQIVTEQARLKTCSAAVAGMRTERDEALWKLEKLQIESERRLTPPAAELDTLVAEIGSWADDTFCAFPGNYRGESIVAHLRKEVLELQQNTRDMEEVADCVILLFHLAHQNGWSLTDAIRRKFAVLKTRKWGEPDADGVIEHVRDSITPSIPPAGITAEAMAELAAKTRHDKNKE